MIGDNLVWESGGRYINMCKADSCGGQKMLLQIKKMPHTMKQIVVLKII